MFCYEKQAHSFLASFQRYRLLRVESKWFVLLSSYTHQCLIRFKFINELYFVAKRTKQLCMQPWGVLKKFYTGRLRPEVQPLNLSYTVEPR